MWFFVPTDHLTLGSVDPFGLVPCRISLRERAKHTYVAGITGQGKSKLLEHLVFQDIVHGRGCGVIDPHSDLIDDLLRYLTSHPRQAELHWDRILYVDPARSDYLVPYNVLCSRFSPYETATNFDQLRTLCAYAETLVNRAVELGAIVPADRSWVMETIDFMQSLTQAGWRSPK